MKNKKLLTSGVLWAYGLACVATNQKNNECRNVLAEPTFKTEEDALLEWVLVLFKFSSLD